MFYYFDPIWCVFALPPLLLAFYAQWKVSRTYSHLSTVRNTVGITGAEAARRLLDRVGLQYVGVEGVPGDLTDHYDPSTKVLRLSQGVARMPSVASLGIVAHEIGHALQDQSNYVPLRLRAGLVPAVNIGSNLGPILFIVGFMVGWSGLAWVGVGLFALAFVFAVVTLPVELNASRRAMALLEGSGLITMEEYPLAKSVLDAAALTYVAAVAQALGQLLYYVFLLTGARRRGD
jgi:Zn-dependent membrane protease YugP